MPKLSPIQWLVFAAFLAFYGFAVFAITRDYYLRSPPRTASAPPPPHGLPRSDQPTWIQREMQAGSLSPVAPTSVDPLELNQRADELFAQKRYAEAIAFYRRVIEVDPADAEAHNDLGLALHYTGASSEALEVLREGTRKDPAFQRVWLTLGFVSANSGDRAAAREALEKARSLDPGSGVGQEAERLLGLLDGE
jgi:tetratricopeptide (TPR) repeat protein